MDRCQSDPVDATENDHKGGIKNEGREPLKQMAVKANWSLVSCYSKLTALLITTLYQ